MNGEPAISLILAMDEQGTIGRDGGLPWRLPDDLKHFRRMTMGHIILMGRVTFESLGRPLPGRDNWVLSRNPHFAPEGARVFADEADVLAAAKGRPIKVIGGAALYEQWLPRADAIELTRVHTRVAGDTHLADPELSGWCAIEVDPRPEDECHAYPYTFLHLRRR